MRVVILASLLCCFIGGVAFVACQTSSETPNAYFGRDGGPGDLGQLCRGDPPTQCNEITLVCTDEDGEDGPLPPICRFGCDTTTDDCGDSFVCVPFETGPEGACLAANLIGELCTGRCDDGLVCIEGTPDAGGLCRTECTFVDGGVCPDAGSCNAGGFCQ